MSILPGELLAAKSGYLMDERTLRSLPTFGRHAEIQVAEDLFLAPLDEASLVTTMPFINHSCDPTAGLDGSILVRALRHITPGEEITVDYAMYLTDPTFEMTCNCGSAQCRRRITGDGWLKPGIQARYRNHFSAFVQGRIDAMVHP